MEAPLWPKGSGSAWRRGRDERHGGVDPRHRSAAVRGEPVVRHRPGARITTRAPAIDRTLGHRDLRRRRRGSGGRDLPRLRTRAGHDGRQDPLEGNRGAGGRLLADEPHGKPDRHPARPSATPAHRAGLGEVRGLHPVDGGRLRRPLIGLVWVKFAAYILWMAGHNEFRYVVYDQLTAMTAILLLHAYDLYARTGPAGGTIVMGVVVSLLAAILQQAKVDLHRHFNHNDLFHVVQIGANYLFFRGALLLRDRDGEPRRDRETGRDREAGRMFGEAP